MTQAIPSVQAAEAAVRQQPGNPFALMELGAALHDHGRHEEATRVRQQVVALLTGAMAGHINPELGFLIDSLLYRHFVKKIETEQHARDCFQSWLEPMAALGRRLRDPQLPQPLWAPTAARPWRAAFLLQTPAMLGHTDALFELLRHRPRGLPWHDAPVIFVLSGESAELTRCCAELGVQVCYLESENGRPLNSQYERLASMRRRIAAEGVSHFVWVSAPGQAIMTFAMRVAPVQVFWTLKFHPFRLPEIDEYITHGNWGEIERRMHGELWKTVWLSIGDILADVDPARVAAERAKFARHDILFGVLAREEKLNSEAYLAMVTAILQRCPQAGFVWAGRSELPVVTAYFARHGVADRCHFIGWVDTSLYVRVIDVFLETFPFGCGITAMQALAAGTPFVSLAMPDTQYGLQFLRVIDAGGAPAEEIRALMRPVDGGAPLAFADTEAEYLEIAVQLAVDAGLRRAVGAAGQRHYAERMSNGPAMARRFFDILADARQPGMATGKDGG